MPFSTRNPNLRRRLLPGLLVLAASVVLRPLLGGLRRRKIVRGELTIFASYMVGDLYMALPALRRIGRARPVRVLCRPDCVELLEAEGLRATAFSNPFREKGWRGLGATLRASRALRGRAGDALDLDADPRTALWMRLAGLRAVSYRRAFGTLFHETFELPEPSVHQADRDMRLVEAYHRRYPLPGGPLELPAEAPPERAAAREGAPWIFSVWTRKPKKNWPLENWEALLQRAREAGVPCMILDAPDGDAAFQAFRARWRERIPFLRGSLAEVSRAVREAAGVAATDNFLGHMAGYHGKPVLWINRVSPSEQVIPRGPRTLEVRAADPSRPGLPDVATAWRALSALLAKP